MGAVVLDWAEVRRVGINGYVEDPEKDTWKKEEEEEEEKEEEEKEEEEKEEEEKEDRCLREYGSQPCV